MKFGGLQSKVIAAVAVPVFALVVFFAVFVPARAEDDADRALVGKCFAVGNALAPIAATAIDLGDAAEPEIRRQVTAIISNSELAYAVLLEANGSVFGSYASPAHAGKEIAEASTEARVVTRGGLVHAFVPLTVSPGDVRAGTAKARIVGTLVVGFSRQPIADARTRGQANAVILGGAVLLLGIGIAWMLSRRIVAPVLKLRQMAAQMAAGNLAARTSVLSGDEIGELSEAFNRTAEELERAIAERLKADASLRLAERLATLGTLVSGVAHEINNPLMAVLGNTEYVVEQLERRAANDGSMRALSVALTESLGSVERIRKIVKDLRIFSRGEATVKKAVDVNRAIQDAIGFVAAETRNKARVVTALEDLPPILGDGSHLSQVVINLVVNAAHAMPSGQAEKNCIRVATRREGADRVVITVADTGPGLPDLVKRQLFTPFTTTKEIGMGMGLGLSIVHGLVTSMGGTISVESEEGKGTTFEIRLPIGVVPEAGAGAGVRPSTTTTTTTGADAGAGAVARRGRVLLVDDDVALGNTVRRLVSPPYDVATETKAADALERFKAGERFDVILCDLMMPGMSGAEFYKALGGIAEGETHKFVFVTGSTCSPEVDAFLARTGRRHLAKPFTRKELEAALTAVVTG